MSLGASDQAITDERPAAGGAMSETRVSVARVSFVTILPAVRRWSWPASSSCTTPRHDARPACTGDWLVAPGTASPPTCIRWPQVDAWSPCSVPSSPARARFADAEACRSGWLPKTITGHGVIGFHGRRFHRCCSRGHGSRRPASATAWCQDVHTLLQRSCPVVASYGSRDRTLRGAAVGHRALTRRRRP
jgi:hypothetical protein